jgi:hypothetical protein
MQVLGMRDPELAIVHLTNGVVAGQAIFVRCIHSEPDSTAVMMHHTCNTCWAVRHHGARHRQQVLTIISTAYCVTSDS